MCFRVCVGMLYYICAANTGRLVVMLIEHYSDDERGVGVRGRKACSQTKQPGL